MLPALPGKPTGRLFQPASHSSATEMDSQSPCRTTAGSAFELEELHPLRRCIREVSSLGCHSAVHELHHPVFFRSSRKPSRNGTRKRFIPLQCVCIIDNERLL